MEPVVAGDAVDGIARNVSRQHVALIGKFLDLLVAAQQWQQRQRQPIGKNWSNRVFTNESSSIVDCGCSSVGPVHVCRATSAQLQGVHSASGPASCL